MFFKYKVLPVLLTAAFCFGVLGISYAAKVKQGGKSFIRLVTELLTETETSEEETTEFLAEETSDTITETEILDTLVTETESEPITESETEAEDSSDETEADETTAKKSDGNIIKGIKYISQLPNYPNGCESVSTVMVLNYFGIDITVDDFIDKYLDRGATPSGRRGSDPNLVYVGNPRKSYGWGCYAHAIKLTLDKFINPQKYNVEELHGKSLSDLCTEYIDNDVPVIMWATEEMAEFTNYAEWTTPEGVSIKYPRRLHCLVFVGYDSKYYYFADPEFVGTYEGSYIRYKKKTVEKAYAVLEKQCVVVTKISGAEKSADTIEYKKEPDTTETTGIEALTNP